jgi:hypothetical protein
MAKVVVGVPLATARPDRPGWLGALQGLDLGRLVHAQDNRVRRRLEVQPDHVPDLGLHFRVGGELEGLDLPGLEVMLGPDASDRAVADPQLARQQPT